jgi:ubiquinone biosynthesis protein
MDLRSVFNQRFKNFRRYRQILRVLLHYGFEETVTYMEEKKRFGFIRKFIPRATIERAKHLTKWEKMRLVCEELGPTFVKFGQLMSNRPDVLPIGLIVELEKLQDGVPPVKSAIAIKLLEDELGKKITDVFESFENEAFASASMAQVHKAKLRGGESVVIKIQRPGIKEVIESDIRVMKYLAEVLTQRIPSLKSIDPPGLVRNFEESIMRELDFVHESVNIKRFHANFSQLKKGQVAIRSPRVFSEFSTSRVLTMEFIDGVKINDIKKLRQFGYDRKLIAKRLAEAYLMQIFNHGFFHADPHPGNLLVLKDSVICFLDYGMMGNIMQRDLEQLGRMFNAVRSKDVRKILFALQQLSDQPVVKKKRALEADLNEFVQNHAFRKINKNEMSTILIDLKDIIVKYGLKAPSHFFLLGRSMMAAEGVIRQLDPDLDLEKMSRPYIFEALVKHYNPSQFAQRVLSSVYELGMYMEEFPRDIKTAIRKINTGEVQVDLTHKGIDPLANTIHTTGRQLVYAMILSALIVASTLMIIFDVHPHWGTKSLWGILGFIFSGIITWRMLRMNGNNNTSNILEKE